MRKFASVTKPSTPIKPIPKLKSRSICTRVIYEKVSISGKKSGSAKSTLKIEYAEINVVNIVAKFGKLTPISQIPNNTIDKRNRPKFCKVRVFARREFAEITIP